MGFPKASSLTNALEHAKAMNGAAKKTIEEIDVNDDDDPEPQHQKRPTPKKTERVYASGDEDADGVILSVIRNLTRATDLWIGTLANGDRLATQNHGF